MKNLVTQMKIGGIDPNDLGRTRSKKAGQGNFTAEERKAFAHEKWERDIAVWEFGKQEHKPHVRFGDLFGRKLGVRVPAPAPSTPTVITEATTNRIYCPLCGSTYHYRTSKPELCFPKKEVN